jgi:Uma2 family endonuclease
MSTRSAEYLEAIEHLPMGGTLTLYGVSWEEYEALLDELHDKAGRRVSYDAGRLEIMSPLPEHEEYKEIISDLARAYAEENRLPLEKRGSATWKSRRLRKGTEPDTCFYITNASRIVGKRQIDLESDPPPDIAVEVDTTSASLHKFAIYAALGVPEIWRYDGKQVEIYVLIEGSYVAGDSSNLLSGLSRSMLTEFIEISKTQGQTATLELFRARLRARETN